LFWTAAGSAAPRRFGTHAAGWSFTTHSVRPKAPSPLRFAGAVQKRFRRPSSETHDLVSYKDIFQPAFSIGLDDISSIRSIGRRARLRISAGSSIRGERFFMQSRTFSSVFIFIYLHSLQRQLSDGNRMTLYVGAHKNSLPRHSFCI